MSYTTQQLRSHLCSLLFDGWRACEGSRGKKKEQVDGTKQSSTSYTSSTIVHITDKSVTKKKARVATVGPCTKCAQAPSEEPVLAKEVPCVGWHTSDRFIGLPKAHQVHDCVFQGTGVQNYLLDLGKIHG